IRPGRCPPIFGSARRSHARMNRPRGALLHWWCAAMLALFVSGPLSAQEKRSRPFLEDNHAFRFILHAQGATPLQAFDELNGNPAQTLLVVFGETKTLAPLLN